MSRFECDLYPELRVRCLCCDSGCCDRFEIDVTPEEVQALEALHIPGTPPAEECFTPVPERKEFILNKGTDHHCIFADGKLCKIHKLRGYAAKPLVCRIFPFHIEHWRDGRVSAELRFICPGVGCADGKRAGDLLGELGILARQLGFRRGANDCVYSETNPAPLETVRKIHRGFRALLHDAGRPFPLRCYAAARILEFHTHEPESIRSADGSFAEDLTAFVRKAVPELTSELESGRMDALIRAELRSLICGYLRDDNLLDRSAGRRLRSLFIHVRVYSGQSPISELNPAAPQYTMRAIPGAARSLACSNDAQELFFGWFYGKLDSMHFCGTRCHNYTYEQGMRHLLLSVPVVMQLAAAYALAAGDEKIERDKMLRAVRLADFSFGRSPFFRLRAAKRWIRRLAVPKRYAALLGTLPALPSGMQAPSVENGERLASSPERRILRHCSNCGSGAIPAAKSSSPSSRLSSFLRPCRSSSGPNRAR